jgi:predicted nucleic acid-binding protein
LEFDLASARIHAEIYAELAKSGQMIGAHDLMIAAIARSNGAAVVTRNVADFEDAGVTIIDPWVDRP